MSRHRFVYEVELYEEVNVEEALNAGAEALEEKAGVIVSQGQSQLATMYHVIGVDTETSEPFEKDIPAESHEQAASLVNDADDSLLAAKVTLAQPPEVRT